MKNKFSDTQAQKIYPTKDRPILIVGSGLSAFILALHLKERDIDFTIIGELEKNQSSLTAAGIFNPIVFKRMNLSWKAEELIPFLNNFYSKWESTLNSSFLHHIDITRPISTLDKIDFWKKRHHEETGSFTQHDPEKALSAFKAAIAMGRVNRSGWLDTNSFLSSAKEYLSVNFLQHRLDLNNIELTKQDEFFSLTVLGKKYSHIIWAEGHAASSNPLWSFLPWKLAKGEVLEITFQDKTLANALEDHASIISKDIFLLPLGNGRFRLGSNYEWEYQDKRPSEEGKKEILEKLQALFGGVEISVEDHKSGIRPTVADRRPFLGRHPRYAFFSIFNGMGSKGVMLAPFFAEQLIQHLLDGHELHPETDIARFPKRFRNLYETRGVPSAWS